MANLEKTLYDLCVPMVENVDALTVKTMSSADDREILLYVYADSKDIARLIGIKGVVAGALRSMVSVANRGDHKRLSVKFESLED